MEQCLVNTAGEVKRPSQVLPRWPSQSFQHVVKRYRAGRSLCRVSLHILAAYSSKRCLNGSIVGKVWQ